MSCRDKRTKANKITQITKDNTLGEVLSAVPKSKEVLMGFGMHCFGCPVSQMETLEEASQVHGIELEFLLQKLNDLLK